MYTPFKYHKSFVYTGELNKRLDLGINYIPESIENKATFQYTAEEYKVVIE